MTLTVYNGEFFESSKWRYVAFTFVIIVIIGLSLRKKNIVGVILLFFILGAYIYYTVLSAQTTKLTIKDKYLAIGEKAMPWQNMTGYLIEGDKKTQIPKNIVLITKKGHSIYTINDTEENIHKFIEELDNYLPMNSEYKQNTFDKRGRILQI